MTVQEMHIDFEQGSQQIASNRTFKYEEPEIDWILNKAMDRFIKLKLKPKMDERGIPTGGFEVSQLDADAIRSIIVSSYDLVPYIDQDNRRYRCFLPPDYSYLLSDWSYTTLLCQGDVPKIIQEQMYILALRQDNSTKATPRFYESVQVQLGNQTISIPADLPYGASYSGYEAVENISFLRPYISLKGQWYWERFDNLYYPKYYIFPTTNPQQNLTPYCIVDGVPTAFTKQSGYPVRRHDGTGKYYDNRLSATDNISGMNSTEYIKSSHYSPISELSNGLLYIYNDDSFIVSSVGISYVRKPQPISLYLNTDCELPEEFHRTIVDLAIEYAKQTLQNLPGYQAKAADNDKRVVI
jgi:hypothetical protein